MRVMIAVTHLLGTGHLARATTLAKAFAQSGHDVRVVSGGMPAPHLAAANVPLDQLPPLRSDGVDFTNLLDDTGNTASTEYLEKRQSDLLRSFSEYRPDVLITELFPFGRRGLKAEFLALLQAAKQSRTKVFASIRDILAPPSKPAKAEFAEDVIDTFYTGVFIHGDPEIAPLSKSWPVSPGLEQKLHYTGFVAPKATEPAPRGDAILVSTGGGNVGDVVFAAALEAAQILTDRPWHLLVGGGADRVARYADRGLSNLTVEGLRPDFRTLLSSAAVSINLVGYNTALDILQSGTPSLLVPFDDGNEVEQSIRADALKQLSGVIVRKAGELNGRTLASDLETLIAAGPRPARLQNMDGAARTVQLCEQCSRAANGV